MPAPDLEECVSLHLAMTLRPGLKLSMNRQVQLLPVFQDETGTGDKFWPRNNEILVDSIVASHSTPGQTDGKNGAVFFVPVLDQLKKEVAPNSVLKMVMVVMEYEADEKQETGDEEQEELVEVKYREVARAAGW